MSKVKKTKYGKYTIESESYQYQESVWEGVECKRSGPTLTRTSHAVMSGTFVHGEFKTLDEAKKWIDMRPLVKPHNDKITKQIKALEKQLAKVEEKFEQLQDAKAKLHSKVDTLSGSML